jgi:hypothetical protein
MVLEAQVLMVPHHFLPIVKIKMKILFKAHLLSQNSQFRMKNMLAEPQEYNLI